MKTMAKAKKKPATKPTEPVMTTRGLRMSGSYAAWLDRFAKSERMSVATLIDRGMAAYAEQRTFEAPPERVL
jgi:hypothetical protein